MEKEGTSIGDYDLIEANEAFAVQALADGRDDGGPGIGILGHEPGKREERTGIRERRWVGKGEDTSTRCARMAM